MKVSVIMPVYNAKDYLQEAIDSILNQTIDSFELICIDDGSTDDSWDILLRYSKKDSRIKLIRQENKYAGAARNRGMEIATGDYLAFMDADDIAYTFMLEKAYKQATDADADIVIWGGKYFKDNIEDGWSHAALLYEDKIPSSNSFSNEQVSDYIFNFTSPAPWNKLFKRDFVINNKLHFQEYKRFNDMYFVETALVNARAFGVVREELIFYRTGNNNSLQHKNDETPLICIDVLRDIKAYLEEKNLYQKYECSYRQFALSNMIYSLDSISNYEAFVAVYDELKNKAFEEFKISESNVDDYYHKYTFQCYEKIMRTTPRLYWHSIKCDNSMLYSFDIFDTLITRKTATPYGIFSIMSHIINTDSKYSDISFHVRENFFRLRISCEKQSNKIGESIGRYESTLEDIYRMMLMTGEIDVPQAKMLANLEREVEIDNVIGIKDNIELLFGLYDENKRVVLISDMYLDEATIRKMLTRVDSRFEDIELYVSSSYGMTKRRNGDLYRLVRDKIGIQYENWIHYGDNENADIYIPKQYGITTRLIHKKQLLPIEEHAISYLEDNITTQLLIGAAVNSRSFSRATYKNQDAYFYGTTLLNPFIYGYMKWVLHMAIEKEIESLYFIARDGYILKKFADRIIEIEHLPISTYYIYGSREAWRLVGMDENFWDIPLFFRFSHDGKHTLESIANRFHISEDKLKQFLPENANHMSLEDIADILQNNTSFRDYIIRCNSAQKELVLEYLQQEIDFQKSFAFVEFIGSGYSQRTLSNILTNLTDKSIISFFYRLDWDFNSEKALFYSYCPGLLGNKIIECFLTAPHGHTSKYFKEENGKIIPVLDDENKLLDEYGMDSFRAGIDSFLRNFDSKIPGLIKLEEIYNNYICNSDDGQLMDFIGDIPFNNSGREHTLIKYAPKLSDTKIREIYLIRKREPISYFYKGMDLRFSMRRSKVKAEELSWDVSELMLFKERVRYWDKRGREWASLNGYDKLFNDIGKSVAIYGAGIVGKRIAQYYLAEESIETIWVDKAYEKYKSEGWDYVMSIDELKHRAVDNIIIAVKKRDIVSEIIFELTDMGFSRNKMILAEDIL